MYNIINENKMLKPLGCQFYPIQDYYFYAGNLVDKLSIPVESAVGQTWKAGYIW